MAFPDLWEDYAATVAVRPYSTWDTMAEIARLRRNRAKLASFYKWLWKGNNRQKRIAYMKAYNKLAKTKERKKLSPAYKAREKARKAASRARAAAWYLANRDKKLEYNRKKRQWQLALGSSRIESTA